MRKHEEIDLDIFEKFLNSDGKLEVDFKKLNPSLINEVYDNHDYSGTYFQICKEIEDPWVPSYEYKPKNDILHICFWTFYHSLCKKQNTVPIYAALPEEQMKIILLDPKLDKNYCPDCINIFLNKDKNELT